MGKNNSDFYTAPWGSETSELLEKKGFVNNEDQIENNRSEFHLIINKRNAVFITVDTENLENNRQFVENMGEKLNPTTFKEIQQWQM